jgi:hypothetical protein
LDKTEDEKAKRMALYEKFPKLKDRSMCRFITTAVCKQHNKFCTYKHQLTKKEGEEKLAILVDKLQIGDADDTTPLEFFG